MSVNIYDYMKIDTAQGQIISAVPVMSYYFSLAESQNAAFLFTMGETLNAGRKVSGQLYQAKDQNGTDSKVITGATCEIEANIKCKNTTASLNSVSPGDTIVINGLTFTAHATTTTYANREFSIAGGDDTGTDELIDCINHPEYGVLEITAIKSGTHHMTMTPTIPGIGYITTVGAYSITVRSWAIEGLIEVNADMLDYINGYNHVAIQLTPSTSLILFAAIL
ncbi:MAG: hypothetical protein PVI90_10740, partial [Desulfobacteraceae bacterium]